MASSSNVGYHRILLRQLGNALNDDDRRLMSAIHGDGCTVTELAARGDVSPSCISHRKSRVLAKMLRCVGEKARTPQRSERPILATSSNDIASSTTASDHRSTRPLALFEVFILFCLAFALVFARACAHAAIRLRAEPADLRSRAPGCSRPGRRRDQRRQIRGPPRNRQPSRRTPQKGKRCSRNP